MRPFQPLVRNAHWLTLIARGWPRYSGAPFFPVTASLHETEPGVKILVHAQRPRGPCAGEVVLVHGLEGSSRTGYMRSMARTLVAAGFVAHRMNIRSCGGTEFRCRTFYHAGLTVDLRVFLERLVAAGRDPAHVVGFSLGGNLVLKLAGELGEDGGRLIKSVCAISTPLELAACTRRMAEPQNRLYNWYFVDSMKRRLRRRHQFVAPAISIDGLDRVRTLWDFDDRFTAAAFGFRDAEHYYATQSAAGFLAAIRVPALLIQAKDDPFIPFSVFDQEALRANPRLRLLVLEHGGHLGFLARERPRFWVDGTVRDWLRNPGNI